MTASVLFFLPSFLPFTATVTCLTTLLVWLCLNMAAAAAAAAMCLGREGKIEREGS